MTSSDEQDDVHGRVAEPTPTAASRTPRGCRGRALVAASIDAGDRLVGALLGVSIGGQLSLQDLVSRK